MSRFVMSFTYREFRLSIFLFFLCTLFLLCPCVQLLQLALHVADLANPAKPLPQCTRWAQMITEEFYAQGDS